MIKVASRSDIHALIDAQLDEWGIKENLPYMWAGITFQLTFEKGGCKLVAVERTTTKEFTPRGGAIGSSSGS